MIHGMWGGAWYWGKYKRFFESKGYRCHAPTLRFHDADPTDAPDPRLGTTSLLDYAQDLEEEIRQLDGPPIIMGHSMGGLLAQILGSRGYGKALVLLTPAPPYGIVALRPSVIRSSWSSLTTWGFWRKPARPTFDEAVYGMLHLLPVGERREVFDRFVYESGRAGSEIGFWLLDGRGAAKVDERKVTCPVLVVGGVEDRITPASVTRKVAEKYDRVSTYKEFAGHAHWVVGEPGWEQVAKYVSDWLDEVL
ncbi:MAG: alpha/beta fold hydrolase [Gemmatimonadales bacterium]|nr:alpha/beta fold hydrolase [Gemmatimonadales bacterium]NIN49121.1 alpha/beta fold hydrolase [Gemmatimonadales bacterium]NIP06585.1 alpha/beta fold hydrolase [Gemmatimonadales bacterium]NIR00282.1 alpha/beta fold hydrolase [Gemmatimonadales bacterium]NIS64615.1 alpha/beta fold hydrolase [Gemmatimonadales bacterium]